MSLPQHLDGELASQLGVAAPQDCPGPAEVNLAQDLVPAEPVRNVIGCPIARRRRNDPRTTQMILGLDQFSNQLMMRCELGVSLEVAHDVRALAGIEAKLEVEMNQLGQQGDVEGRTPSEVMLDRRTHAALPGTLEVLEDVMKIVPCLRGHLAQKFIMNLH